MGRTVEPVAQPIGPVPHQRVRDRVECERDHHGEPGQRRVEAQRLAVPLPTMFPQFLVARASGSS